MRGTRLQKWLICGVLCAMLLTNVGCDDPGALVEIGLMFAPELLGYKIMGTTGDETLDALLQAKALLDNIDAADALMKQAREQDDPDLMEEAIALRPDDWHYRLDAAKMNLAQNDLEAAERHLTAAENALPPDDYEVQLEHSIEVIEQFEGIKGAGDADGYTSVEQCQMVHDQLVRNYNRQWSLTGREGLSPRGQQVAADQAQCAQ